ncbi:hypothetical protein [uncultured Enterovirga sp.]|uniref:hypothetical protein n=1 Tax=uncultured Enterovirga sp. TaxID=2026352 RepID=UPI0035CA2DB7
MSAPDLSEAAETLLAAAQALLDTAAALKTPALCAAVSEISTSNRSIEGGVLTPLISLSSRLLNADLNAKALGVGTDHAQEVVPLFFPLGLRSPDGSAILGREGYLFLIGGSNDVLSQYDQSAEVEGPCRAWMSILAARISRASVLGMQFVQTVIPEKITIISDLFPTEIATPTPLLSLLEAEIAQTAMSRNYVSCLRAFGSAEQPKALVRRADSHLSPLGTFTVFRELVLRLTGKHVGPFEFSRVANRLGDLSLRMMGSFNVDQFLEVDPRDLPDFVGNAARVSENSAGPGRVTGTMQVWENPHAPFGQTVVAFGNSYFSVAENGQPALSWWFSRWFKKFVFVWTNEVDFDFAEHWKADVVIWQGNERFLRILPGA